VSGRQIVSRFRFSLSWRRYFAVTPLVVLLGCLIAGCSPRQAPMQQPAVARLSASAPGVWRATLPNGLQLVIVRDALAPVVTTELNYRVGSLDAPPGFPGLAHAEEHMLFRGSRDLSSEALAAMTAYMGGDYDAQTQQVATQYYMTAPADELDLALRIHAASMRGALNSEAAWDKERKAIEQEVAQDDSSPQYVLYAQLLKALFQGTPYSQDALGSRPSFERTTAVMLQRFYSTWYAPNNAILVIVGNVNPQQALAQVQNQFGTIPARRLPARQHIQLPPVQPQTLHLTSDSATGMVGIAFRLPGSASPDYAAAQVLVDVLRSERGKLYALVTAGKALSADMTFDNLPKASIGIVEAGFPRGGNARQLQQEMKRVLMQAVQQGVPADLVAAAKRQEITNAELQKNSVSGLAETWSDALAIEGRQSPVDDLQMIRKVTVADVNRVARTWLDQAHAVTAIQTPQSSGVAERESRGRSRESLLPAHSSEARLPGWARNRLNQLKPPPLTVHPSDERLANGLRLIIQPEQVSDTVSVYGRIRNNWQMETPPGKEGVDAVMDGLFDYGTTDLGREAFQKAVDDLGAQETGGTDFSLKVLRAHFAQGVGLLADHVLHPALPAYAFHTVQQQVLDKVAGEQQSPDYLARRELQQALLPAHDPGRRRATPKSIGSVTLADVQDYYRQVFRPDETTIVVIGNVSPQQAREVIRKYFGGWQNEGEKPNTDMPPAPLNRAITAYVPDRNRVQDKVDLEEMVGVTRQHPDYYALLLGNTILSGDSFTARLYRDLRENSGLVYSVDAWFDMGRRRSTYTVEYASDAANVARARALIEQDVRDLQQQPVSVDELRRGKVMLLRAIALDEASTDRIAGGLLNRAILGLPLNEPDLAARRYLQLDAQQVQAAFQRWLRVPDLTEVVQGPAPQ
jgi:zinc protease